MPSCLPATSIHQRIKPFASPVPSRFFESYPFRPFYHSLFSLATPIRSRSPRVHVSGTSCLFYSSSTLRLAFCTSLKGRRIAADRCYGGGAWKERRKRRIHPFYPLFCFFSSSLPLSAPLPAATLCRRKCANISTRYANLIRELLESGRRFLLGNSALFMSVCEARPLFWRSASTSAGLASPTVGREPAALPARTNGALFYADFRSGDTGYRRNADFGRWRKTSESSATRTSICASLREKYGSARS